MLAEQAGYYDELCLDVELQPSFSTANYPIVAAGDAEFASGGSFSEVVDFATANDADIVAVDVEGRTAIDSLIVKPGTATSLEDLAGSTIGVKGTCPPSVAAMLAGAGLVEGDDYETVLLDGFDPLAHYALDDIAGFPGYKSNEPGQLERAGLPFELFDPTAYDVPGSFGVIFTSREFAEQHPTATRGLPAGDDARTGRRHRRSRRRGADGDRARRGQRQPELPLPGGRVVPLGHGRRPAVGGDAGRHRHGRCPTPSGCKRRSTPTPRSASSTATPPTSRRSSTATPIEDVYDDSGEVIWPSP